MMLPSLTHWEETAQSLHQVTALMGAIRRLLLPHVPNYLELALQIRPTGLSTERLPNGAEVSLDMSQAILVFQSSAGDGTSISLARTQPGLLI